MVFASVQGPEGRRENVQTESKTCRSLAEMTLSVVRKNPQEPAQTRGSRQKKANPEGKPRRVGFSFIGGAMRTWVQTRSHNR